ncbi:hypothetical protein [Fimbriimonas ginsengisoli]|uniref:Phage shock protein B n=1 Tax=Fimbriimonas ginsengisoli Gsoil 348 TaxID=661478 RepID=A0A068NW95_FIMGI|nr:hypothetical protein [Fimbriimonas ginsengisoli]AIE87721.1 hypothetical protein OP10G_4353 [Fimbriimonas ginsengisoli Gsoil 348]
MNPNLLPLADIDSVLGVALGGIFLMTPIIFILTKHQQKMAEIMRRPANQVPLPETDYRLQSEVAALRDLVRDQTLALDDLARSQRALAARLESDPIRERLGQG